MFKKWDNDNSFNNVFINQENGVIAWDEELEIDSDTQYLKLTGLTFEEWESNQLKHA